MAYWFDYFLHKGVDKDDLYKLQDAANSTENFKRFAQMRYYGTPMEYILGEVEFMGRKFQIEEGVYIPNKETENLVRVLMEDLDSDSKVLGVGPGTGCIEITLKKEMPYLDINAVEISIHALSVARENCRYHDVHIHMELGYYVDETLLDNPTHIVANMPWGNEDYVLASNTLSDLAAEPKIAIFPPGNPTEAYQELIDSIQRKHWKTRLYIESGLIEKEKIDEIIPPGLGSDRREFDNYSVTIVEF